MAVMSNSTFAALKGDDSLVCRPVQSHELRHAIAMVLGGPHRPAPPTQVTDFITSASERHIDIANTWIAHRPGVIAWAVLPIPNPGRTLLLLTSAQIDPSTEPAASRLVAEICSHYARQGVQLAQLLMEPQHEHARRFFLAMGFHEIAELIYLQGQIPRNAKTPEIAQSMRWVEYSEATHPLFAQAIQKTYIESLDCPMLSGLRNIEDVIVGHRATGQFEPHFWQLLADGPHPLGVVLLSRIAKSDAMELVYLGLAPEARRRGIGIALMQQALHLIHNDQRRRLSLAVDSRNNPALRLYYRFGFQQVATRWALIRDLRVAI
jgi:ribosomal protein S18 acetylase RimI-like enzyme